MKPLAVGALPTRPHACSPRTSPARSAASQTGGSAGCPTAPRCGSGSRTCTNPGCDAEPLDLRDRGVRDRAWAATRLAAQARVALEELGAQPVVDAAAERGLVVDVVARVERRDAVQHGGRACDRLEDRRAARRASRARRPRARLGAGEERRRAGTCRSSSATAAARSWRRSRPSRRPCARAAARRSAARRGRRTSTDPSRRSADGHRRGQPVQPARVAREDLLLALPATATAAAPAPGRRSPSAGSRSRT